MLPWYIENMKGEGDSSIGAITVVKQSGIDDNRRDPPKCTTGLHEATVFQVFDISGYGKLQNRAQVVISAVVDEIPPFSSSLQMLCS
jgi:hypothetical protein